MREVNRQINKIPENRKEEARSRYVEAGRKIRHVCEMRKRGRLNRPLGKMADKHRNTEIHNFYQNGKNPKTGHNPKQQCCKDCQENLKGNKTSIRDLGIDGLVSQRSVKRYKIITVLQLQCSLVVCCCVHLAN